MTPFLYDGEAFESAWDPFEIAVFGGVAGSVISVLKGANRHSHARQRLLPPLSKDKTVSSEFDRLAGHQISDAKIQCLEQFQNKLLAAASAAMSDDASDEYYDLTELNDDTNPPKITLTVTQAEINSTLSALTAIRTYLAEILDIQTDDDSEQIYQLLYSADQPESAEPDSEDLQQQKFFASTFAAAGFVQETLLEAVVARGTNGA